VWKKEEEEEEKGAGGGDNVDWSVLTYLKKPWWEGYQAQNFIVISCNH